MSRSPVASSAPSKLNLLWNGPCVRVYVPAGTLIVFGPVPALASITAARNEHLPNESAQTPSPGFASAVSTVVLTVKEVSRAADCDTGKNFKTASNETAKIGMEIAGRMWAKSRFMTGLLTAKKIACSFERRISADD